jgi:hypothetical protein
MALFITCLWCLLPIYLKRRHVSRDVPPALLRVAMNFMDHAHRRRDIHAGHSDDLTAIVCAG